MATPIVISWPAANSNSLAASQSFTGHIPLTFNNIVYRPNPNNFGSLTGSNLTLAQTLFPPGQVSAQTSLPFGNVRRVQLYSTANLSATSFIIIGLSYGQVFSEVVNGPNDFYSLSQNYYQDLIGVIPLNTVAGEVSVGFSGGGQTQFLAMDGWNKSSSFSISYSVTTQEEGESVEPFYAINPLNNFVNGQQDFSYVVDGEFDLANYGYLFPYQNPNILVSPYGTTYPYEADSVLSSINIPLTAIGTVVSSGTPFTSDFAFTQTIIQQGGKF